MNKIFNDGVCSAETKLSDDITLFEADPHRLSDEAMHHNKSMFNPNMMKAIKVNKISTRIPVRVLRNIDNEIVIAILGKSSSTVNEKDQNSSYFELRSKGGTYRYTMTEGIVFIDKVTKTKRKVSSPFFDESICKYAGVYKKIVKRNIKLEGLVNLNLSAGLPAITNDDIHIFNEVYQMSFTPSLLSNESIRNTILHYTLLHGSDKVINEVGSLDDDNVVDYLKKNMSLDHNYGPRGLYRYAILCSPEQRLDKKYEDIIFSLEDTKKWYCEHFQIGSQFTSNFEKLGGLISSKQKDTEFAKGLTNINEIVTYYMKVEKLDFLKDKILAADDSFIVEADHVFGKQSKVPVTKIKAII